VFDMTEQTAVGRAVRSARQARGLSLRATAATLGVSPATLSAVERGRTPVSIARLGALAELLDVPPARLLAGEATPVVPPPSADADRDWRDFSAISLDPILEAATRVFVSRGFHAAGMREVAAEAGLSVAGVYHHFPSKQRLLAALLDFTMAEIGWRIAAARDEGDTPLRSFALMVEALALFHAVRGDLAFLGASEMRGLENPDLDRVIALRDGIQYALDHQARAAIDAGYMRSDDPRTACRAIATMCTSLPSWFRPDGALTPSQVAKRYAEYAVTLLGWSPDDAE
jgi:AcrR family transcriptional regulator/DNA-binding XRE family transcriptional regulator